MQLDTILSYPLLLIQGRTATPKEHNKFFMLGETFKRKQVVEVLTQGVGSGSFVV